MSTQRAILGAAIAIGLSLGTSGGVSAQQTPILPGAQPWRPSPEDSIRIFADRALALLQDDPQEFLTPKEIHAYGLLNQIVARHFSRLGPKRMNAAAGVRTLLDSIGIKTEISQDPDLPAFTLIHFLHPVTEGLASVAYLHWFRGEELLFQPFNFRKGRNPQLEVTWIGSESMPYEAGIIYDDDATIHSRPRFVRLRMLPDASAWLPVQGGDDPLLLGGPGVARWVDMERDGIPEVVSWSEYPIDPVFEVCDLPGCPKLRARRVFVRDPGYGYRMTELRLIDSPVSVLVLFTQALRSGDEREARSLTTSNEVVEAGKLLGLDQMTREGSIQIGRDRSRQPWEGRLRFHLVGAQGTLTSAEARFESRDGKWRMTDLSILDTSTSGSSGAGSGTRGN